MTARQKNYKNAFRQLVNAKIKEGQEQEAADLKAMLILGQATEYFETHQYQDCLIYLENNEHQVGEHALFAQRLPLLRGLCCFYLANYEETKKHLKNCGDNAETLPYYFYYLLSLVYESAGEIDHSDLPQVEKLSIDQQHFLRIVLDVQKEDYADAVADFSQFKETASVEKANAAALKDILKQTPKTDLVPTVKPLYRAMSGAELTENEITYLSRFTELTDRYHLSDRVVPQEEIRELLEKLCERGEKLTTKELELCWLSPEELHPAIVYNQAAVLVNEDNPNKNNREIKGLITNYYRQLCQIPEFIYLYAWVVSTDDGMEFSPNAIKRTLFTYVNHFADRLTAQRTEELSAQIIFAANTADVKSSVFHEELFISLLSIAPDMRLLRFELFKNYLTQPNPRPKWALLNVFSEKNSAPLREFMQDGMGQMIDGFISQIMSIDLSQHMLAPDLIPTILNQVLNGFSELLKRHPPFLSDNFPIELICIVGDIMLFHETKNRVNIGNADTTLIRVLKEYIDYFKEPEDSPYRFFLKQFQLGNSRDSHNSGSRVSVDNKIDRINAAIVSDDLKERQQATAEYNEMLLSLIEIGGFGDDNAQSIAEFIGFLNYCVDTDKQTLAEAVAGVKNLATGLMKQIRSKSLGAPINILMQIIEGRLIFAPTQVSHSLLEAFIIPCQELLFEEKNIDVNVREILQEYFGDILDADTHGRKIKIDKTFHSKFVEFLLEIENKSRRRKFKGILKDFQKRILK